MKSAVKNYFARMLSLYILVIVCFSCKQYKDNSFELRPGYLNSIKVNEPKTYFKNGIFTVAFKIESDYEGDAFVILALRQTYKLGDDSEADCDEHRGFGNDARVDGYQIRSYHQMIGPNIRKWFDDKTPCHRPLEKCEPLLDYPVFLKKIKLPKGTINEEINICLPDGFNWCWGEILVFRNSHALEESMKTKIDVGRPGSAYYTFESTTEGIDFHVVTDVYIYHYFFPDSSMFSHLITSNRDLFYFVESYEKSVTHYYGSHGVDYFVLVVGISDPVSFGIPIYKEGDVFYPRVFW